MHQISIPSSLGLIPAWGITILEKKCSLYGLYLQDGLKNLKNEIKKYKSLFYVKG